MAATWTVTIDFQDGGGARDIKDLVLVNTIRRKRKLWSTLKPTVDTVSFSIIHDATIWNLLLTQDDDFLVVITKDAAAYFAGVVYTNYEASATTTARPLKMEVADNGILLKRKKIRPATPDQWADYYVCNTSSKSTSIVHQLLYDAGVADVDIDATDILTQIDYYMNVREEVFYFDKIAELLYEYGYVFYHDESGTFKMYNFLPTSVSASDTFDNDNMLDKIRLKKTQERYEGVEVQWSPHETQAGVIVFTDTTGGGEAGTKARIPIDASEYYPPDSNSRNFYADYRVEGREIVTVNNAELQWAADADISDDAPFTDFYKKALVSFLNGGAFTQYLYQFDIVGDAILVGDLNITRRLNVADTEKILELKAKYLVTLAEAQKFADGVARYYEYTDFRYTIKSKDVLDIGAIADIEETETIGISTTGVVVDRNDDERTGIITYICEGLTAYSGRTTTTDATVGTPAAPPDGRTITPGLAAGDKTLIGYWPLNDTPDDFSGYGNHGVLSGEFSYVPAHVGRGIDFSPSGWMDIPEMTQTDEKWSVNVWAYVSSASYGDRVVWHAWTAGATGWLVWIDGTGRGGMGLNVSSTQYIKYSGVLSDGWHMLTLVYDDPTITMYADAVLIGTDSIAGWVHPTGEDFQVSADGGTGAYMNAVCQLRIYDNKALSQSEITFLVRTPSGVQFTAPVPKDPGKEDLVLYMPLDEIEGTRVVDASGNGHDGTLTPGSGAWEDGKVGNAYHFDGAETNIDISGIATTSTSWSVSFQMKVDSFGNSEMIMDHETPRTIISLHSGGVFRYYSGGSWGAGIEGFAVDIWYHVVFALAGTMLKLYRDGILIATQTVVAQTLAISTTRLGTRYTTPSTWFDGLLDEFRLYDKTLTPEEVLYLYRNPGGVAKGLVTRNDVGVGEIGPKHVLFGGYNSILTNPEIFLEEEGELFPLDFTGYSDLARFPEKKQVVYQPAILRDEKGTEYYNPRAKLWDGLEDDPRTDTIGVYEDTENLAVDPEDFTDPSVWSLVNLYAPELTDKYIDGKRLNKITCNSATSAYMAQAFTFTAAVYSFQVIFERGTAAGTTYLYMVQGANQPRFGVSWASDTVSAAGGMTIVSAEWINPDIVRITGYATMTAAAATVRIYPSSTEADGNYCHATAVQFELKSFPTPYTPTTRRDGLLFYRRSLENAGAIETWIRPRGNPTASGAAVVFFFSSADGSRYLYARWAATGSLGQWKVTAKVSGAPVNLTDPNTYTTSSAYHTDWHFKVVWNFSAQTGVLQINGVAVDSSWSGAPGAIDTEIDFFSIGANYAPATQAVSEHFNGEITDLALYSTADSAVTHHAADAPFRGQYSMPNYDQSVIITRKILKLIRAEIAMVDMFGRTLDIGTRGVLVKDRAGEIVHDVPDSPFQKNKFPMGHLFWYNDDTLNLIYGNFPTASTWIDLTPIDDENTNIKGVVFGVYIASNTNVQASVTWQIVFRPKGSSWGTGIGTTPAPMVQGGIYCPGNYVQSSGNTGVIHCPVGTDGKVQMYALTSPSTVFVNVVHLGVYV